MKHQLAVIFCLPRDEIGVQNEEGRNCKRLSFTPERLRVNLLQQGFSECPKDVTESRGVLVSCLPNSSQISTAVLPNPSEYPCSCLGSAFSKDFQMKFFLNCPEPIRVFLGCWPAYTGLLWFIRGLPRTFF